MQAEYSYSDWNIQNLIPWETKRSVAFDVYARFLCVNM